MPRIAAAIGVFATIAICIFINIKNYPAVWDMVGTSSWSTQETNTSPQDPLSQPTEIAENDASKKPSAAPLPAPKKHVSKVLPSLKPQLGNRLTPATDPWADSPVNRSAAGSRDIKTSRSQTAGTQTRQAPFYQGLNPGPIKVPGPDGAHWPAEISPKMKYAAKPPLLESYQQWNPERPVVPVVRPKEDAKNDAVAPAECKTAEPKNNAKPNSKDSSRFELVKKKDSLAHSDNKEAVRRLPAVDPRQRPIRMRIQGVYPEKSIPIYPSTGS